MSQAAEVHRLSGHKTWIEIDLNALSLNLRSVREFSGPRTEVMAVVKANAYGHGLAGIARALSGHVTYLAVSSLREALELRERDIDTPVFMLAPLLPEEHPLALTEGMTLTVSSCKEAAEISESSVSLKRQTSVHIKVDTGMGRLGIPLGHAIADIQKIAQLPALRLEGIYTHFPSAESDDGFRDRQVRDFSLLCQALESKEIVFPYRHAANSSGTLKVKSPVFNMVRPGLMLYGIFPDDSLEQITNLTPVLSLKSRIISLKRLSPGDSVGYGRDFIASDPTTIALLPVGYSHGYPWNASNNAYVLYRGKQYPVAGRVSMDYLAVNLGDTHAQTGDTVTLIGKDGDERITAEDLARWAETIPYEIITQLNASIPRFYL